MNFKRSLLSVVPLLSLGCVAVTAITPFVADSDHEYVMAKAADASEYDQKLASWSKEGHLYLHYNRGEDATAADYDKYALWLWQHAPKDISGSLWAYSGEKEVSSLLTLDPMTTGFMENKDAGGSGSDMYIDGYGAIIDVDMTATIRPGRVGDGNASLAGATELGFLIVLQSSMGGGSHWTSDGGKNTYLEHINQAPKINGAIHVYLNSGDFDSYVYESSKAPAPRENPTTKDTSGQYSSKTQSIANKMTPANSSASNSPTADAFKSLGVGYQVFVASFRDSNGDGIGDIRGVINSLDYLKDLGVQVLWLTPIQKSDSYHGYDISDYYAVDPRFGTVEDYRELIYKAHKSGMKVLMDLVLNHTSKSNVWFKKSQWAEVSKDENGNDINWRNVYHWKYETDKVVKYDYTKGDWSRSVTVKEDAEAKADSSGVLDSVSWYRDGESHYYYYGKFGSGMPEINYEYQPTRDLVKNMAKYWLSFGLDGFRLDAVKHIYMKDEVANTGSDTIIKDVGTRSFFDTEKGVKASVHFDYSSDLNKNITWWKEFATDLKKVYPNCFLVGENFDGYGNRTAPYYQALDSQFGFNHFYHIPEKLLQYGPGSYATVEPKEGEEAFRGKASEYWVDDVQQPDLPGGYRTDFIDGSFTSNHDVMRAINHVNYTAHDPKAGTTDNPKITNTTDQVANAKVAAAVTMLTPGLSWIYYGDELGMSSNTDKHIEKYKNENSMDIWYRQPMKWGGDAASQTTDYSAGGYKIEWDDNNKNNVKDTAAQAADNSSMLNYYKLLNKIKAMYPKNAKVTYNNEGNVLWFDIAGDGGKQLRIFIRLKWVENYYEPNNSQMMNETARYTQIDTSITGYTGGAPSASTPVGAIGAWYK